MKVFIAAKYDPSDTNIFSVLKKVVASVGGTPYAFIDEGHFNDGKEMMKRALAKLDENDILLIEASKESIGIGIEAGYYFHKRKPIISIFQKGVKISRTLLGVSNECIEYENIDDLKRKLKQAFLKIQEA